MHQVFKYKAYNKVLFDKKKLWHFFSKIELQRQWSCVMCTWQGLFNARGKNFALPPPLTGRNIHSGSKGGVKNQKHKFKFCLILSYFPHLSNWNCLKQIFFFNLNIILWLLVRYWNFCFDIYVWYIPLLYGILPLCTVPPLLHAVMSTAITLWGRWRKRRWQKRRDIWLLQENLPATYTVIVLTTNLLSREK